MPIDEAAAMSVESLLISIRLCVGIEQLDDILGDLQQAFAAV